MDETDIQNQSLKQKKMAFAGSEHVATVIKLLQESAQNGKLVGDSEFETLRNAITMDAQAQLIMDFIHAIDNIKNGSLHETQ